MSNKWFRGFARIKLDDINISHPDALLYHREVDQDNVKHLLELYRTPRVGCRHHMEEYSIRAIVDDDALQNSTKHHGLPKVVEDEHPPLLELTVDCLEGFHRVLAAQRYLDGDKRWWLVRLYSRGKVD
jgi:Protein of unknown function (DUF3723)